MALVTLPPELRTICRRLTSTKVEQLPPLLPLLLKEVGRCQEHISQPWGASSEASVLIHKLKTHITSLLNGRTSQGRFVGAALVKAVVEAGGWECLRTSGPWVSGLISAIQKKDPTVAKELYIVTLTKIFTLMHGFPTLVRELVTPSLSGFVTACLRVLKPPTSSKVGKAPYSLVETIFEAISTLIPLHPTTLRQFSGKFRTELQPFLAPTISDNVLIPATLQMSSRHLAIRLHMTAAKGGDSTEWTKHLEDLVQALHSTADQVFRAVHEIWESTIGYKPQKVDYDAEPQGSNGDSEQFPGWVGVQAGGERIIGLLDFIADHLRCHTRVAIAIPITAIMDVSSRISSIKPPMSSKERTDTGMNSAIGREERDELWTVFPDIQIAVMRMHLALIQRMERNYIPLAPETLDQSLRILQSTYRLPQARTTTSILIKEILYLCGPTLSKPTVESLSLLMKCCCRDLLGAVGYLPKPKPQGSSTAQNGQNPKTISQNADAFLPSKSQDDKMSVSLSAEHISASEALLTTLFSHLPQQYIPSSIRSQMVKTAILCRNRDAQVASILHPARDRSGRTTQVILPYITQQFPRDESVEILRFNFRPMATGPSNEFMETDDTMAIEEDEAEVESKTNGFSFGQGYTGQISSSFAAAAPATQSMTPNLIPTRSAEAIQTPFLAPSSETKIQSESDSTFVESHSTSTSSLKRKNEDATAEISLSKRVEIDITRASVAGTTTSPSETTGDTRAPTIMSTSRQGCEDDSSDDESVHLNMDLDSGDEEDDDE
ncbi:rRNA processing/ribosome biogenesis-domain-containing protein [Xylaria bambusicola]|uniref:rRNA processing/ribosome biogenesis-domain-containing protein n=1 Tax=Xylaria bambusicola TaxID=326684 RepID=UPI002007EBEF|nr:rRNA processing/ribosome biogenesis-domain-containing protein [Xylaria bambusicola]KAI0526258.1 rRNA processing/ribosome biogenesis-domain-containing protein [Xylaria bambusicola]